MLVRMNNPMRPYLKSERLMVCPHDLPAGRQLFRETVTIQEPVLPRSYIQTWFLWEGQSGK
jgi:hypothetical protein